MRITTEPLGDFSADMLPRVKSYLLIEHDLKDDLITTLLRSAVAACEKEARFAIRRQRVTTVSPLNKHSRDAIWLPLGPVEVESVTLRKKGWGSDQDTPAEYKFFESTSKVMTREPLSEYDELVVVYLAGEDFESLTDPTHPNNDLELAVLETMATFWENRAMDKAPGLPNKVINILANYFDSPTYHS